MIYRSKQAAMKELTNEQKLEVLEEALKYYDGYYLCYRIARAAQELRYINSSIYIENEDSAITQILIPELLQFKPEEMKKDDPWFGKPFREESTAKRTQVLKDLIEMIRQKELD
jgi:hypothetical protein